MVVGLLLSACGGGDGGASTLFDESFTTQSGAPSTLTDAWAITPGGPACTASNTDPDVLGAPPQGNPTYGLVLRCQGTITSSPVALRSKSTFVLNGPTTFTVDARVDSTGTFGGNPQPGMNFSLAGLNGGFLVARLIVGPASATYYMNAGGGFGDTQVTRTYPADGLFHRYAFVVNGSGSAEWRRDGVLEASSTNFSTTTGNLANTGNQYIELQAPPSTADEPSEGHFDNVRVTTS